MLLTGLARRQLVAFAVIAVVSLGLILVFYGKVPSRLGIGSDEVVVHFTDSSGLYEKANVSYRGARVGEVTALEVRDGKAVATLTIDSSARVPEDVSAELHSTSAIGEQYVDLIPRTSDGPYLEDGSVIPVAQSEDMPQFGPVLNRLNRLLESVPEDATSRVLREVNQGLGGAGRDLGGVVDSSSRLVRSAQNRISATKGLIQALDPVLTTQRDLDQQTVTYARRLARFSGQVEAKDQEVESLLRTAPPALRQARGLVTDVDGTLPALLTNLTTNANVLETYLPNLRQTLVVYPTTIATLQSTVNPRARFGDVQLDLRAGVNNPPSCSEGYLPVPKRRSPSEGSVRELEMTGNCAVPKSDPRSVRGDRNLPCPNSNERATLPAECGLQFRDGVRPGGRGPSTRGD